MVQKRNLSQSEKKKISSSSSSVVKTSERVKIVEVALETESSVKGRSQVKVRGASESKKKIASGKSVSQQAKGAKSSKNISHRPAVIEAIGLSAKIESVRTKLPSSPTVKELKVFRKIAEDRKLAKKMTKKKSMIGKDFLRKPPRTGKRYSFDLRVHSPSAEGYFATEVVDSFKAIVRLAKAKGLDIIGVCDCFNGAYVDAIRQAAEGLKIRIIPGIELRCRVDSCNDVPLIALFPETCDGAHLFSVLTQLQVPEVMFGNEGYCIELSFDEVIEIVEGMKGVLIPCHLDKTPFRQMAISPLVEQYGFRSFDLVHLDNMAYFEERWPMGEFTFFSFSAASSLAQIGIRFARVKLVSPGFEGIKELVKRNSE